MSRYSQLEPSAGLHERVVACVGCMIFVVVGIRCHGTYNQVGW